MQKIRVLFVCIHNSARSQMAEELLRKYYGQKFEPESAGLEPGKINPVVAQILKEEEGIDISLKKTQSIQDVIQKGTTYDFLITVCDETAAERCPVFPGQGKRLHWGFPDPSQFNGTFQEKKFKTKEILEKIKIQIEQWVSPLNFPPIFTKKSP